MVISFIAMIINMRWTHRAFSTNILWEACTWFAAYWMHFLLGSFKKFSLRWAHHRIMFLRLRSYSWYFGKIPRPKTMGLGGRKWKHAASSSAEFWQIYEFSYEMFYKTSQENQRLSTALVQNCWRVLRRYAQYLFSRRRCLVQLDVGSPYSRLLICYCCSQ